MTTLPRCAHPATIDLHRLIAAQLPTGDEQDFDDASRGFIGSVPDAQVGRADGSSVWNLRAYGFLDSEQPPDTVNPSLWRQARLNRLHGQAPLLAQFFGLLDRFSGSFPVVDAAPWPDPINP